MATRGNVRVHAFASEKIDALFFLWSFAYLLNFWLICGTPAHPTAPLPEQAQGGNNSCGAQAPVCLFLAFTRCQYAMMAKKGVSRAWA